ncbi:type II toxin-antitoxin system HicB family antitoxin [Patescibacteria group bacterium]|nr:type II toxin-antitoxin system HicB family antitoxin [Patescibacteria group bacterium]MCL5010120.1 type II toxin-antitoxin system HicB family antitoxin [Patescibacteria group bacterium]
METQVLNYRIIIRQIKEGRKTTYLAECPTLGVYDWGDTVNNALQNIQEGIECHLRGLVKDAEEIPADYPEKEFITETKVTLPINTSLGI